MRLTAMAVGFATLALVNWQSIALSDQFEDRKRKKVETCRAIPEDDYSTALIFNPTGQSTMYHRSQCLQDLARDERDASLCTEVKERKSWFFDGSAISETSCRQLVAKRIEKDRQEAESKDFRTIHQLTSVQFLRNGNRRDFDLVVATEGSFYGSYEMDILAFAPDGLEPNSIYKKSYSYGTPNVPRHILLRRSTLRKLLGDRFEDLELTVQVTLVLKKTEHNRFYYDLIPTDGRTSQLRKTVRFGALPPWEPG